MKQNPLAFQTLDSYIAAKELARRVHIAKISDAELRDQATRAAKSTFLCLCEGLPNTSTAMKNVTVHPNAYYAAGRSALS